MKIIIIHLLFTLNLHTGKIKETGDVDGRPIYSMPSANIEYAYKAEIIQYLKTGTFSYNENLID